MNNSFVKLQLTSLITTITIVVIIKTLKFIMIIGKISTRYLLLNIKFEVFFRKIYLKLLNDIENMLVNNLKLPIRLINLTRKLSTAGQGLFY